MIVTPLEIADVLLLAPRRFEDERGWFEETFNARAFAAAGLPADFVQDNQSLSRAAGTVRGLHLQVAPHAQAKLVRVLRGAILDVAVDVRAGSPTRGRSVAAVLDAASGRQLFVPRGFAHGFRTLVPDTVVAYKVDGFYDRASERGIRYDDPDLAIDWTGGLADGDTPSAGTAVVLSDKDRALPAFRDVGPLAF